MLTNMHKIYSTAYGHNQGERNIGEFGMVEVFRRLPDGKLLRDSMDYNCRGMEMFGGNLTKDKNINCYEQLLV